MQSLALRANRQVLLLRSDGAAHRVWVCFAPDALCDGGHLPLDDAGDKKMGHLDGVFCSYLRDLGIELGGQLGVFLHVLVGVSRVKGVGFRVRGLGDLRSGFQGRLCARE